LIFKIVQTNFVKYLILKYFSDQRAFDAHGCSTKNTSEPRPILVCGVNVVAYDDEDTNVKLKNWKEHFRVQIKMFQTYGFALYASLNFKPNLNLCSYSYSLSLRKKHKSGFVQLICLFRSGV
jgi:hypothetical protein